MTSAARFTRIEIHDPDGVGVMVSTVPRGPGPGVGYLNALIQAHGPVAWARARLPLIAVIASIDEYTRDVRRDREYLHGPDET